MDGKRIRELVLFTLLTVLCGWLIGLTVSSIKSYKEATTIHINGQPFTGWQEMKFEAELLESGVQVVWRDQDDWTSRPGAMLLPQYICVDETAKQISLKIDVNSRNLYAIIPLSESRIFCFGRSPKNSQDLANYTKEMKLEIPRLRTNMITLTWLTAIALACTTALTYTIWHPKPKSDKA